MIMDTFFLYLCIFIIHWCFCASVSELLSIYLCKKHKPNIWWRKESKQSSKVVTYVVKSIFGREKLPDVGK